MRTQRDAGILIVCLALGEAFARGQEPAPAGDVPPPAPRFDLHFQLTTTTQWHPAFPAHYSGQNSLSREAESATTVTATLFLGARLWKGAELYVNPELSGGRGFSQTFGVAGFPNGEAFRVGDPQPVISLARVMLRHTIAAGNEAETVAGSANQLGGPRPARRWTITLGRFGITDIFDDNEYSHDPRTQFSNWAGWTQGAWDYPADTRGYTWGLSLEYDAGSWAAHLAAAAQPRVANGLRFDHDILHAYSLTAQFDRRYELVGQKGVARLLAFYNRARMGNYREALALAGGRAPDVTATRRPGRGKWGLALNFQQALGPSGGLFLRASWNDGSNEAWAYAEIERSATAGGTWKQLLPGRPEDQAGIAFVVNALSADHRDYLAAGGYGFMIGDGRLRYGLEKAIEVYYRAPLLRDHAWLTFDCQFIQNPAYNRDRGPVSVFGLRFHAEI